VALSGHKIGAPKGVGALVRRREELHLSEPLLRGGGQERGLRPGTENVAAIAGFGAAAAAMRADMAAEQRHVAILRERLEAGLRTIPGTEIFAAGAARVPNTTLFATAGITAETALIALDLDGVAVSSGSACSSGRVSKSHVLAAMGIDPKLAAGAIRVSTGPATTENDIDRLLEAWRKRVDRLPSGGREIAARGDVSLPVAAHGNRRLRRQTHM
jgi:cysteine desulfurase